MEQFLGFWEHITSGQRMLIFVCGLIFFWLLEGYYPLFDVFKKRRYRHALGVNLFFLSTTLILNLIFGLTTIKVCDWVMKNNIGLLNLVSLPLAARIPLTLFFMDFFGQYLPHFLMHKVKWMWKFHLVHHSDTKVDVTTGTRHHPGEWLFRESSTILGIVQAQGESFLPNLLVTAFLVGAKLLQLLQNLAGRKRGAFFFFLHVWKQIYCA